MPHVEIPLAEFKVVILGDSHIGKTSLVTRFAEGYYRESSRPATIGAFFVTKRIQSSDGVPTKIQIWDTAGAASFRAMAPMFYKNAAAVVVCYDVTRRESYEGMREWLDEVRRKVRVGEEVVVAIAALKTDLLLRQRDDDDDDDDGGTSRCEDNAVPEGEAERLAEALGVLFLPTSAKTDRNVNALFQCVADEVLKNQKYAQRQQQQQTGADGNDNANNGAASNDGLVLDKEIMPAQNRGDDDNNNNNPHRTHNNNGAAASSNNERNDRIKIVSPRKRDQFDRYYVSANNNNGDPPNNNNNGHHHPSEQGNFNSRSGYYNDTISSMPMPPPESSCSKSTKHHNNNNNNNNNNRGRKNSYNGGGGNGSITPSTDGTLGTEEGDHPLIVNEKKDLNSSGESRRSRRSGSGRGKKDGACGSGGDDDATDSGWACQPVSCGAGEEGGCILS